MKVEPEKLGKSPSVRIGISGSYGGMNLGDECILQSILTELRRRMEVEVVVFCMNPENTEARHDVDRALPVRELSPEELEEEIGVLDLFILGGGGLLYDGEASHFLREVRIAKGLGVPVMTWALGAGPLEKREERCAVRRDLSRADAISVRSEQDRRLLRSVGLARDVSVTADPALLMQPEPFTPEMLKGEGIEPGDRVVGFCVREPGAAAPGLEVEHYHSLLANAADFLVDGTDATVVFVPMERRQSDLQHAHGVISRMAVPQKARILQGEYSPAEVLGFMPRLEFAVGMRLHFLIFCALSGVPFVPLPYASKVDGFIEELGVPSCPIQDLNAGQLLAHIDRAWETRAELRSQLERLLNPMVERAGNTADVAAGLVRGPQVPVPQAAE